MIHTRSFRLVTTQNAQVIGNGWFPGGKDTRWLATER
jgi:hypothetical protein